MEVRVDCPSPLYEVQVGDEVKVKKFSSQVTHGCYLACLYNDKVVGMLDDIEPLMKLNEDDYVLGNVVSSTVVNFSTILIIKLL